MHFGSDRPAPRPHRQSAQRCRGMGRLAACASTYLQDTLSSHLLCSLILQLLVNDNLFRSTRLESARISLGRWMDRDLQGIQHLSVTFASRRTDHSLARCPCAHARGRWDMVQHARCNRAGRRRTFSRSVRRDCRLPVHRSREQGRAVAEWLATWTDYRGCSRTIRIQSSSAATVLGTTTECKRNDGAGTFARCVPLRWSTAHT